MKRLSIIVELHVGTEPERCMTDTIQLATQLDCAVKFDFNDIPCLAYPNGDAAVFLKNLRAEQACPSRYPFVSSSPK